MNLETSDTYTVRGETLKRRLVASVTEGDAFRTVAKNPRRYQIPNDAFRPNMLKARDDAMHLKMNSCSASDPWVRELITQWVEMSGLPSNDADFWRERGFLEAIKAGRDLQIRRYLDDDGWAWIVTRDSPSHWSHKKRLPETTRLRMMEAKKRKEEREKRWW